MVNGGRECTYTWHCSAAGLEGLRLQAIIQEHADEDLFRERLVFSADSGTTYRLTSQNGRKLYTFGSTSLHITPSDQISVEELRIATWNGQLIPSDYTSSFGQQES